MKKMIYIGDDKRLLGETALTQEFGSKLHVQFDSMHLPQSHSWHEFDNSDFTTIEEIQQMKHDLNVPTIKELILCLPDDYRAKILEFIDTAQVTLQDYGNCEIKAQYETIRDEVKKYQ